MQQLKEPSDKIAISEHTLKLKDGTELFFRAWQSNTASKKALIIFHRGHEHSGRLINPIKELGLDKDIQVFAWDARGHGRTGGDLNSFEQLVEDIDEFINFVSENFEIAKDDMILCGHSFAAVALASYMQKYKPAISGLILLAPAFKINLIVPYAFEMLKGWQRFVPHSRIRSYVSGSMLTRCQEEAKLYDVDQTISREIRTSVLIGLREAATELLAEDSKIAVPTLLIIAENDVVVDRKEQELFFSKLAATSKTLQSYPRMRHDIFHEEEREKPLGAMKEFIHSALLQNSRMI